MTAKLGPPPTILSGLDEPARLRDKLEFTRLTTDGRVGVEVYQLYSTEETGPGGPAAAIVYYHPGAAAEPHRHPGYEIIHVLDGELITDAGVHPAGTMLVMPPDSVHAPRTEKGVLMLVVWEQPVEPADI
jgi:anti-sigma factor ChrR (cupin superfamily)